MNFKKIFILLLTAVILAGAAKTEAVPVQAAGQAQGSFVSVTGEQARAKVSRKVLAKKSRRCTKKNIRLLASIIHCEAGNQPYSGKLAVGIVVMNRVRSSAYPDTVKGVIYQKFQFGPVSSGILKKTLKSYDAGNFTSKDQKQCIRAAKEALNGAKKITVKSKRKVFSNYYGFNNVKPSCSYYKLGGHYFRK